MNLSNYPNKANSWLNGKTVGNINVLQVYRDNNTRSPGYVALCKNTVTGQTRVCSYSMLSKAMSRQDRFTTERLFSAGNVVGVTAGTTVHNTTAAQAHAAYSQHAAAPVTGAALTNLDNEDVALGMMTALVKAARSNPRVARIVKTMSELV